MNRFKTILLHISIVVGVMLASIASAQPSLNTMDEKAWDDYSNFYKNSIKAEFKVYIDDKPVETETVKFRFMNHENKIDVKWDMSGEFMSYLKYNEHYTFEISVPGYNTKSLKINTQAPTDRWVLKCKIFLYSNQKDEYTGELAYNFLSKTFKHYE